MIETDSSARHFGEPLSSEKNGVRTGPVPGWVAPCSFADDFQPAAPGHLTHLLFDQQIHAELRQTFFHMARRLDTMQAVQSESPWQLDFEPDHEQVTLHWIRTRRNGVLIEHTNLSSARIVDRSASTATASERLTLTLMLEDVRPGDILEWCHTVESRPLLLPENWAAMFTLPVGAPVGKFYFSILFNAARLMRWKSSDAAWLPEQKENNGEARWIWTRENYPGFHLENNAPDWLIPYPWIQVSDFPGWEKIAEAFAGAWKENDNDPILGEIVADLITGQTDLPLQAERAIQMVQDEYRGVAASGKLSARPPVPPGTVARRRYGDGKDLSCLLMRLLQRLGVPAGLILVNTTSRKSLFELLPDPGLFNHVLVACEVGGTTRWIDATGKGRSDFGAGLPVTGNISGLIASPSVTSQNNIYDLTETILLDTSGSWSWLSVTVKARGAPAEALRRELETDGLETWSRKRERDCADRFVQARRIGALKFRDDRAANEFFLAEIFEIKGFLVLEPKTKWFKLNLANEFTVNSLPHPDAGPRRLPFALPYPSHIAHTVELYSVALPPVVMQQRSVQNDYLYFVRNRRTLSGNWTLKLTLSTRSDAVPPESVEDHRKAIEEIRTQSAWSLLVPPGDARPHQRGDFGSLPTVWNPHFTIPDTAAAKPRPTPAPVVEQPPPTPIVPEPELINPEPALVIPPPEIIVEEPIEPEPLPDPAPLALPEPPAPSLKRLKRHRRKDDRKWVATRTVILVCVLALTLIALAVFVAKNADRFRIFGARPQPPPEPTPANTPGSQQLN